MQDTFDQDYIIIGSGFGGSVSALRLSEKGYRVTVLETGKRWSPANLPRSNWSLRRWLWRPGLGLHGFFNIRPFRHVMVLHGNAVGGGSITYANTLLVPPDDIWSQGSWAGLEDWTRVMPEHFRSAQKMLGVATNKRLDEADRRLRVMAVAAGVGDTFRPTEVGVYFGAEGEPAGSEHPDPYFDGKGPPRRSCIGCGGCMVGCRYGAKNTLDLNYLYLAEGLGTQVHPETRVVDVRPMGAADGADGYRVTAIQAGRKRTWTCRGVVVAAGSLGTQDLLLRLREHSALPRLSACLGEGVRTNAESLIGVRYPGTKVDLSRGIAIGSGIHLNGRTHIEATRYPRGSDAMGFLLTVLVRGTGRWRRVGAWMLTLLAQVARHPVRTLRSVQPLGFARETIIFLCMHTLDSCLRMRLKRRWYWPFRKRLVTEGKRIPTCIPEANAFAEAAAKLTGGVAGTSITEVLFDIPMTAHCMGGAVMGADADKGVCDSRCRAFGYRNLLICDGSVLSSNLGVNPSLTITAVVEHAMAHVPPKAGASTG
ncbi:GMC family oxidoreductase [Oleiagrimonas sp.]|jgi:cholesterol oxidase|uniref:GMC oxidoreductase n=1 Tax=Oleiagrimonas sp. TaxID=2010330 RepID=UPI0026035F73|nr:GMC family oxidoreductase [Oleiagrimonas sp.]MDA3915194.1 GMC family oxidoreductase [Oleiagrimonas sp.]